MPICLLPLLAGGSEHNFSFFVEQLEEIVAHGWRRVELFEEKHVGRKRADAVWSSLTAHGALVHGINALARHELDASDMLRNL